MRRKIFLLCLCLVVALSMLSNISRVAEAGKVADTTGKTKFYGVFVGYGDDGFQLAKEVKEKLKAIVGGGWQEANMKLIEKGKATKAAIKNEIDAFKTKARCGDVFLFYYVGHGGNGAINPGIDPQTGKFKELQTEPAIDPKTGDPLDSIVKRRTPSGQLIEIILPGDDGDLQTKPKEGSDDKLVPSAAKDVDNDEKDEIDNYFAVDPAPPKTEQELLKDDELTEVLSGFQYGVSMAIVLDSCFTHSFTDGKRDLKTHFDKDGKIVIPGITQKFKGQDLSARHVQFLGAKALIPDGFISDNVKEALTYLPADKTTKADKEGNGDKITTLEEVFKFTQSTTYDFWRTNYDTDGDSRIDEDIVDHIEIEDESFVVYNLNLDNDEDGYIDEDPDPIELTYEEWGNPLYDYGDAPDPQYASLQSSNGACHLCTAYERLGYDVSIEADSMQVDLDEFDDGVYISGTLVPEGTLILKITISTSDEPDRYNIADASKVMYLNAWIDWNRDGQWETPGEKIIGTYSPTGTQYFAGPATPPPYNIPIPVWVSGCETWLRVRLDYGEDAGVVSRLIDPSLNQEKGQAMYGEVEDYKIKITGALPCIPEFPLDIPLITSVATCFYLLVRGKFSRVKLSRNRRRVED